MHWLRGAHPHINLSSEMEDGLRPKGFDQVYCPLGFNLPLFQTSTLWKVVFNPSGEVIKDQNIMSFRYKGFGKMTSNEPCPT